MLDTAFGYHACHFGLPRLPEEASTRETAVDHDRLGHRLRLPCHTPAWALGSLESGQNCLWEALGSLESDQNEAPGSLGNLESGQNEAPGSLGSLESGKSGQRRVLGSLESGKSGQRKVLGSLESGKKRQKRVPGSLESGKKRQKRALGSLESGKKRQKRALGSLESGQNHHFCSPLRVMAPCTALPCTARARYYPARHHPPAVPPADPRSRHHVRARVARSGRLPAVGPALLDPQIYLLPRVFPGPVQASQRRI